VLVLRVPRAMPWAGVSPALQAENPAGDANVFSLKG